MTDGAANAELDRLREIVGNLHYGVVTLRPDPERDDYVFTSVNAAFERLEGIRAEDAVGRRLSEVLPYTRASGAFDALARVRAVGQPTTHQTRLWEGARLVHCHDVYIFPLPPDELAAIYHDSTARAQAEEAARHAEHARAVARTAVALNHEINTPLQTIQGHAELLARDEEDPARRESLEAIQRAISRIADVVRRIDALDAPSYTRYVGEKEMLDLGGGPKPGE